MWLARMAGHAWEGLTTACESIAAMAGERSGSSTVWASPMARMAPDAPSTGAAREGGTSSGTHTDAAAAAQSWSPWQEDGTAGARCAEPTSPGTLESATAWRDALIVTGNALVDERLYDAASHVYVAAGAIENWLERNRG